MKVNDVVTVKSDVKVDPDVDQVIYKGSPVVYAAFEYYMLHKPAGVLTATMDKKQKTVLDLITDPSRKDLFPVGRLDKDTEGLLLITNDGPLCNKLLSPKHHVEKVYFARVDGEMKTEYVQRFEEGLDIGDEKMTLPAKLEILRVVKKEPGNAPLSSPEINPAEPLPSSEYESEILLTITEGRFHQVKRMCEAVGCTVTYLKRMSMGSLKLDPELPAGAFRRLSEEEIAGLME